MVAIFGYQFHITWQIMIHFSFLFVTRGHCIKGINARFLQTQRNFVICNYYALDLFTFYAVPSSGKLKGTVVRKLALLVKWLASKHPKYAIRIPSTGHLFQPVSTNNNIVLERCWEMHTKVVLLVDAGLYIKADSTYDCM